MIPIDHKAKLSAAELIVHIREILSQAIKHEQRFSLGDERGMNYARAVGFNRIKSLLEKNDEPVT